MRENPATPGNAVLRSAARRSTTFAPQGERCLNLSLSNATFDVSQKVFVTLQAAGHLLSHSVFTCVSVTALWLVEAGKVSWSPSKVNLTVWGLAWSGGMGTLMPSIIPVVMVCVKLLPSKLLPFTV